MVEKADLQPVNSMAQTVFNDLTEKGFWLTLGVKFGTDFLAYEGDPLTCHAKFCVMVLPEGESAMDWK